MVGKVRYKKDLFEDCIAETQGRYIVNFVEDLVTVVIDGSEMDMVDKDFNQTQGSYCKQTKEGLVAEDLVPEERDETRYRSCQEYSPHSKESGRALVSRSDGSGTRLARYAHDHPDFSVLARMVTRSKPGRIKD